MLDKLKRGLANGAVSIVAFVLTYLVCEFFFFRFMLPEMSYNIRPHLPDRADFFMQNSKSSYVPHDYIALLGDSYAAGVGDWLLAGGGLSDKPYHSANVIHDLTGRDVASFGRVNIGSAQAMVERVTRILDDDYCYLFPPIEVPKRFVVYFYEGNDIDDNQNLLIHDVKPHAGDLAAQIDTFLRERYARSSPWACHGHFGDMLFRMARYAIKYAGRPPPVIDLPGTINPVTVGGATRMAGEFQAPPLLATAAELDAGVLVYARSLAWLRGRFPDVPVTAVYVPAPPTVYRAAGDLHVKEVFAPDDPSGPTFRFGLTVPASAIYARSALTCEKIRAATVAAGADFVDARPAFRRAAAKDFVHGPRDWNHPNEAGYRVLGALVAERIDHRGPDTCDDRWE
ncbi:MAG TPA: hypothetical protein VLX44_12420 [Xanthobacteraceae bacterium]|nr:hypothetical protein [Xanthobacteraceae bacterium]